MAVRGASGLAVTRQNKISRAKGERAAKPRRSPERSAGLKEEDYGRGRVGGFNPTPGGQRRETFQKS